MNDQTAARQDFPLLGVAFDDPKAEDRKTAVALARETERMLHSELDAMERALDRIQYDMGYKTENIALARQGEAHVLSGLGQAPRDFEEAVTRYRTTCDHALPVRWALLRMGGIDMRQDEED